MDDFEKLINASDLIEWIMETYPDWCVGDVRSIVDHVMDLPSAQPEITDEQAIEHLQSTGWMQNHDREMYESGLREQLADDSRSYDSLIPCEDTISRQAAIDEIRKCRFVVDAIEKIRGLPSAEPEIIRCKDCDWWTKQEDSAQGRCALFGLYPTGAWYCANARKRGAFDDF